MSSGGARARSGPPKQEGSRTSDRAGVVFTPLPPEGYDGAVPELSAFLPSVTAEHERVWADLWRTPQASWWAEQSFRWQTIADLVMWIVRSHDPDAPASVATNVRQLREDLALTTAGLAHNGLKIAEAPTPAAEDEGPAQDASVTDIQEWLAGGA